MNKSYLDEHRSLRDSLQKLTAALPKEMAGFAQMNAEAKREGALSAKTKHLMALALAITANCDGCVSYYVHDALRVGSTPEEVAETIGVAVVMGGGPAAVYGAHAYEALEQFIENRAPGGD